MRVDQHADAETRATQQQILRFAHECAGQVQTNHATDGALLSWLLRLPEPSKALITSREYSRAFRSNTSVLDLRGMTEHEAQELVRQRLHFLKVERLVSDPTQLGPLLVATGGNKLELLDSERDTISTIVLWTLQHQQYAAALQLTKGSSYFYYIQGIWDKSLIINRSGAIAAHSLGQTADEVEMLAYEVQMLSFQGNFTEAKESLVKLQERARLQVLPADVFFALLAAQPA
jgi:hypothetical protein